MSSPWAGDFREVRTSRSDSFSFPPPQFLVPSLEELFAKLRHENQLIGLDKTSFSQRAAFSLGELNAIHPFREGNGRTQREFVRPRAASRISFAKGDNTAFPRILLERLSPL